MTANLQSPPVMTVELARRIEAVATTFQATRMEGIALQPGNPFGINIRDLDGGSTFLAAKKLSLDWMNTTYGVSTVAACDEALALYAKLGIKPRFDMLPGNLRPEVAERLGIAGLRQTMFHCALYGLPPSEPWSIGSDVKVRPIGKDEIDLFLDVFLAAFEVPATIRDGSKANMRHWADRESIRPYICDYRGEAAGVGVLFLNDGVGYLAASATLPEFRRRGCHSALIGRRAWDAAQMGCALITGQAAFGSTSQNNMERAGLRIAYTKATWTSEG